MSQPAVGRAESFVRFVRLFSLGATVAYPTIGMASSGSFRTSVFIGCLAIGVAFHVFADVGNDVADLPLDESDPRRARGPLVRGVVAPATALVIALAQLPIMFWLVWLLDGSTTAVVALSGSILLIAIYNAWGKSIPAPAVADLIQGAGWSGLVLLGAELSGAGTPATFAAMGFVIAYVAMVNGVHGAVRDLENDRARGMETTAILLGADVDGGVVRLSRPLLFYASGLHLLLWVFLFVAVGASPASPVATLISIGLLGVATYVGVSAYRARSDLRAAMRLGTWHLALVPAALLVLVAPALPGWAGVIAVGCFVAPPLAYDHVLRDLVFDLPATIGRDRVPHLGRSAAASILQVTRPGTWLAAAALVLVGASGSPVAARSAVAASVAVALVVAAANVFNDRRDIETDRVNRPERPLPSGLLAEVVADRFVLIAAAAAVAMASVLGIGAATVTSVSVVVGLLYSLATRRYLLLGEATVAALFASPLLFGAAFAGGGVDRATLAASILVFVFVLSRECLMGVPDVSGDRAAGYRTVAATFGPSAACWAFRVGLLTFLALMVLVPVIGDLATASYLIAASAFVLPPAIAALVRLGSRPTPPSVAAALHLTGVVFGAGLIPLAVLVGI